MSTVLIIVLVIILLGGGGWYGGVYNGFPGGQVGYGGGIGTILVIVLILWSLGVLR
jgi:hypothetical protein